MPNWHRMPRGWHRLPRKRGLRPAPPPTPDGMVWMDGHLAPVGLVELDMARNMWWYDKQEPEVRRELQEEDD